MSTLIAVLRFLAVEPQPTKPKKKGTTMNRLTQFTKILILPLLIAPVLVALGVLTAVPARATPSCGFSSTNLLAPVSAGHFPSGLLNLGCESEIPKWELEMKVKGDSDLFVNQNIWQPGGRTGWHTHPGPSLITVIEGTITVYDASDPTCTPKTYTVGQSFTDIGCGDIHNVVNNTAAVARAVAVQIVPAGQPRRIDEPAPGNCPALTCPP
jgi:quercetin dioxygenase-like cupin family protein